MKRALLFLVLAACTACTQDFGVYEPAGDGGARSDSMTGDASGDGSMSGDSGGCNGTSYMGHCYFLVSAGTWNGTGTTCSMQGAHLVAIGSSGEQMAVQAIGTGDRWIGLSRMPQQPAVDSSYAWSNGDPRTYANWAPGEPNGSGTAARMRFDGTWGDTSETNSLPGICERP